MSGETTCSIAVSQVRNGPFAKPTWRIKHTVTLIDKGYLAWTTNGVGTIEHTDPSPRVTHLPQWLLPADALALVLASNVVRAPEFLLKLEVEGLSTTQCDGAGLHCILDIPERYDDSPQGFPLTIVDEAFDSLIGIIRLAVTRLHPQCPLDDREVEHLRGHRIETDLFVSARGKHNVPKRAGSWGVQTLPAAR